jgi:hypothetical protein
MNIAIKTLPLIKCVKILLTFINSTKNNMEQKIRCIGYMPLLYGRHFLECSLKSVINHVEKMVILYTPRPSYGFGTTLGNPDSEAELRSIAERVCGDKLIWHNVTSGTEGDHRGQIYHYTEGFDVIVAVDSDEVFDENDLQRCIVETYNSETRYKGIGGSVGNGYINFYRSFDWACYDYYNPVRFTNLHRPESTGMSVVDCRIWHFSTAQPLETMQYKLAIHGHKDEIRPNWYEGVFLNFDPDNQETHKDLHLVAIGLWNATKYDKNLMPQYLKEHPFFNLKLIS